MAWWNHGAGLEAKGLLFRYRAPQGRRFEVTLSVEDASPPV